MTTSLDILIKRVVSLVFIIVLTFLLSAPALADPLSPDEMNSIDSDTVWYKPGINSTACSVGGGTLPAFIPDPYNGIFTKAGNAHQVSPDLVAAIFTEENGVKPDGKDWPNANGPWPVSSAGAEGPFQFLPSTFTGLGYNAGDINKLDVAADAAAKYLASNGGTTDKPEGPIGPPSLSTAIYDYNHATWYVNQVLDFYHTYLKAQGGASGSSDASVGTASSSADCSGNLGVSPDGFVFPQQTTKAQLARQKPYAWQSTCTNPVSIMGPGSSNPVRKMNGLCHHDYLASDIFNDTGTPVVAPRPGRIVSAHETSDVGATVRLFSDKSLGGDGLWYYFAHMLKGSEGGGLKVHVGDVVKAGDQLGVVGTDADAQGTEHHTHIDISPVENSFERGYDGTSGPLMDPMPLLKPAYDKLP